MHWSEGMPWTNARGKCARTRLVSVPVWAAGENTFYHLACSEMMFRKPIPLWASKEGDSPPDKWDSQLSSYMLLGKLLHLSQLPFPHPAGAVGMRVPTECSWEWSELYHIKLLALGLARSMHSVNDPVTVSYCAPHLGYHCHAWHLWLSFWVALAQSKYVLFIEIERVWDFCFIVPAFSHCFMAQQWW